MDDGTGGEQIYDAMITLGYSIEMDKEGHITSKLTRQWPETLPRPPERFIGQVERNGTISWETDAHDVEQLLWVARVISLRRRASQTSTRFDF